MMYDAISNCFDMFLYSRSLYKRYGKHLLPLDKKTDQYAIVSQLSGRSIQIRLANCRPKSLAVLYHAKVTIRSLNHWTKGPWYCITSFKTSGNFIRSSSYFYCYFYLPDHKLRCTVKVFRQMFLCPEIYKTS